MNDEQLIDEVARIWVAGGGDVEGLEWCWRQIREAVAAKISGLAQQDDDAAQDEIMPATCCRKHWETVSGRHSLAIPFMVCKTCGNKRCPKATDCDLFCTGSNEPGQEGSVYGRTYRVVSALAT